MSHLDDLKCSIDEAVKAGRGQGNGSNYKPWIQVGEFPSLGTSHRIPYYRHGRVCHFFSSLEAMAFYRLVWSEKVLDIREQYPLLPIEDTIEIADQMNVKHPTHYDAKTKQKQLVVMTTDFLVDLAEPDGTRYQRAYSIKMSKDLRNERTIEKQKIEAAFWRERGVKFSILTERELRTQIVNNIEFLYGYLHEDSLNVLKAKREELLHELVSLLLAHPTRKLSEIASYLAVKCNLREGEGLTFIYTMAALKRIPFRIENGIVRATRLVEELVDLNLLQEELYSSEESDYEYIAT